nr:hypothetical protein [Tanacetum cinerariifolium]
FPRARFADDPQRLALEQLETDPVHRLDVRPLAAEQGLGQGKPDFQFIHRQQRLRMRAGHGLAVRLGIDQQAAVCVLRVAEQGMTVGLFDDFAGTHHADPLCDAPDQIEVVADQQQRHPQPRLQRFQQLQDLYLHGHVQRGGGLVSNQQVGFVGQRHGNHHPLPLTSGQLMGIG